MEQESQPGVHTHIFRNLLHASGDRILGEAATVVYDNLEVVKEHNSLSRHTLHRLSYLCESAIIRLPTINDQGRGVDNERDHRIRGWARYKTVRKRDFQTGAKLNAMPNVHIDDLSGCHLRSVEVACLCDSPVP